MKNYLVLGIAIVSVFVLTTGCRKSEAETQQTEEQMQQNTEQMTQDESQESASSAPSQ